MGEVIDIFPWALERRHELEDNPTSPEEILANLLADIGQAHGLMLKIIPKCTRTSGDEDEWYKKVVMLMSGAKKQLQMLMLQLVDSGLVDLQAILTRGENSDQPCRSRERWLPSQNDLNGAPTR